MTTQVRGPATARRVLEAYVARSDAKEWLAEHAGKLLDVLETDPRRVAALVLGDLTPRGKPTFEALIAAAHPAPKPRSRGRVVSFSEPESSGPRFAPLPPETRPAEKLVRVVQGPEGGPTLPSSAYRHHALSYPTLNPVQSLVLPWSSRDVNLVVAAPTSAGKTVIAEMLMGDGLSRGGKVIFLSPLRAVSQEKYDEWTDPKHPWGSKHVELLTGDYQLTPARRKALKNADVVVMTSEMLDSRSRRMDSEESGFLLDVAVLVVDEAHLLTMDDRGDALEAGLMRFSKRNPHARICLLSATMPNVDELGGWLTALNDRPTVLVLTEWRPTKLTVWWPIYEEKGTYYANEVAKRETALGLVRRFPDDRFLIFVHSKKAGWGLCDRFKECGIPTQFHSADLDRDGRREIETRFRDGDLRVLVATSTLAWGMNLPARRVLVLGVHRGMDLVSPIDVKQMCGRAGRLGLDPEGDAYVLLPSKKAAVLKDRFQTIGRIESTLNDEDVLAFHLCAEVAEAGLATSAEAVAWHARSFASFEGKTLPERGVELAPLGTPERLQQVMDGRADLLSATKVFDRLVKVGIFSRDAAGRTEATQLGRVSSWLYFSPFDVADWASNFRTLVEKDRQRDDACIAWALGHVKTNFGKHAPRDLDQEIAKLATQIRERGVTALKVPAEVLAYHCLLGGREIRELAAVQRGLRHDSERVIQALNLIDSRVLRSLGSDYVEDLGVRIKLGVGWIEARLCRLPGIGAKRAEALVRRGIRSIADVVARQVRVRSMFGEKISSPAIAEAKRIMGTQ